MRTPLTVVGAPSSAGAHGPGLEDGPAHLRRNGLVARLRAAGREVTDDGDVQGGVFAPDEERPRCQNAAAVARVAGEVAAAVDAVRARGSTPLVLGGDCTISIGVVAGLLAASDRVGMIYVDGDVDLNTPATTPSGILDGMGLAHLLGEGDAGVCGVGPRTPLLHEHDVVLFGYGVEAGGIDPPELRRLERSALRQYPLAAVRTDAAATAREALRSIEGGVEHLFLHFDVDVVDYDALPLADVGHRPGLSLEQTGAALAVFASSPKLAAIAVTEANPRRDPDGSAARALVDLLAGVLGAGRGGHRG